MRNWDDVVSAWRIAGELNWLSQFPCIPWGSIRNVGCSCSILGAHLEEEPASEFLPHSSQKLSGSLICYPESFVPSHVTLKKATCNWNGISFPASLCSFIMDVLIYPSCFVQCQQLTRGLWTKFGTRAFPMHWAPWIFSSASHWQDHTCGVFIQPLLPLTCRNKDKFTSKREHA